MSCHKTWIMDENFLTEPTDPVTNHFIPITLSTAVPMRFSTLLVYKRCPSPFHRHILFRFLPAR